MGLLYKHCGIEFLKSINKSTLLSKEFRYYKSFNLYMVYFGKIEDIIPVVWDIFFSISVVKDSYIGVPLRYHSLMDFIEMV